MAIINKTNITVPEVLEDLFQYDYENALVLGKLAYHDNTLVGAPGDTVTVPYTAPLTDAETVAEGDALTPESNKDGKVTVTVSKAGKAVQITQEAINSCAYDVKSERRTQIAKAIARKVDKDLMGALDKTLLKATATGLTYAEIVKAKAKLGEEAFVNTPVLIVNSADYANLAITDEFIKGAVQVADFGVNAAAMLVDMPVIVSDNVPVKTAYLVTPGSFVLVNKQEPTLYFDVNALSEETVMSAFMHYGVELPNKKRGVVKITIGA